jgi:PPOX class probable F420-dependent enzyme
VIKLPEQARRLIEERNFAFVATIMPDGSPQVSPVWIDLEGDHILVNTARGRVKDRNTDRDPRVSIAIPDWQNPYVYVEIRGRVVEKTRDGAVEHIDKMAYKYLGQRQFTGPKENRVIWRIKPERVFVR